MLDKLRSMYIPRELLNESASPVLSETVENVILGLVPDLMFEFVTASGGLRKNKMELFKCSIESLLPQFGSSNLVKIDRSCIKKDGRINTKNLLKIISKDYAPKADTEI